jgi:hypothetical protein
MKFLRFVKFFTIFAPEEPIPEGRLLFSYMTGKMI